MYEPRYNISNRLLKSIVQVEVARTQAGNHSLNYNQRNKIALQTKGSNLFHLAHMLGVSLTLKDAEKLAEGRKLEMEGEIPAGRQEKMRLLVNYRNILEFNRSNVAGSYVELDMNTVVHFNKLALAGWKDSWEIKVRELGESADTTFDDWYGMRDETIAPEQVRQQLDELLEWFRSNKATTHDLIRVAILVFRFVEIMPFLSGNKYTTIGLADLLLYQLGYLSAVQVPLMRVFDKNMPEYFRMWEIAKRELDLSSWLETFVTSLAHDMNESKQLVDEIVAEETEKTASQPFLDLNKRQLKALRYLQNIPTVKREDYCQMMDVSTMTAYRDLNDLVLKKLIKVDGQGRGTKYMLANR